MVLIKYPPFLKHESHLFSLKLPTSVNRKGCDEITCNVVSWEFIYTHKCRYVCTAHIYNVPTY